MTFGRLLLAAAVVAGACLGCIEEPQEENPPPDQPPVNSDLPSANSRIRTQQVWGTATGHCEITRLGPLEGGWCYAGYDEGWYCIGALEADGTRRWTRRTGYFVCDFAVLDGAAGALANNIVAIGKLDADGDGWSDEARILVLDPSDGTLRSELPVLRADAGIWLNALSDPVPAAGGGIEFVAFGAIDTAAASVQFYPYARRVTIADDRTIRLGEETSLWSETRTLLIASASALGSTGGGYVVSGTQYADDETVAGTVVFKLTDSLEVEWRTPVVAQPGFVTTTSMGRSLVRADGDIYLTGSSDIRKDINPADGGYWDAGVIAALDEAGTLRWVHTVVSTLHSERLRAIWVVEGNVYAAGSAAEYSLARTGETFGYGLLSIVERASGREVALLTFGDEHFRSGWNALCWRGGRAIAAGWTGLRQTGGSHQSWYVESDLSGLPAPNATLRSGARATPVATLTPARTVAEPLHVADEAR